MRTLLLVLGGALVGFTAASCGDPVTEPTCSDRLKNGTESDVDCGGSCGPCSPGKACKVAADCAAPAGCAAGICQTGTCGDGLLNGAETDLDCGGGVCSACATGRACVAGTDCLSKRCTAKKCVAPSCNDVLKNGDETDIDCGGACTTKCQVGQVCLVPADCRSGSCTAGLCTPSPLCTNNQKDPLETDVDCGGACNGCPAGKVCESAKDCETGVCTAKVCQAPSCGDAVKNGTESDVDCGGSCAAKCLGGQKCNGSTDCSSKVCQNGVCSTISCTDGIQNGSETDVDCGGPCTTKCGDGKGCGTSPDCQSGLCVGKICQAASCTDGAKNGTETDVDCGGACPKKCAAGKGCVLPADCDSQTCINNLCTAPSCTDGIKNGSEGDVDCGGTCTLKCAAGKKCNAGPDCSSLVCTAGLCKAPTCSDGIQNGDEQGIDCGGATCAACGGTCPMLYTWDGAQMQFESDMFPKGMLALKYASGYVVPNPHDYYLLRHQPAPGSDGLLDLRLVEERREVDYLDQLRLYAVDAAAGHDVYAEIPYVGTSYVAPEKMVHTVELPLRQVASATHLEGKSDVTTTLLKSDGQVLVLSSDRNAMSWNTIEVDLGNQALAAAQIKLIIDARSAMPDTAAGSQLAASKELPGGMRTFLQVRDASGSWVTVPKATVALPIPKEFPRPFVLDISSAFIADRQRARLGFLYKTYVDSVRLDTSADQAVVMSEVPLASASLGYHGISMPADNTEMSLLVYDQIRPVKPFGYFPGLYTAFTDVLPLLKSVDDMFVIFGSGDEVRMKFGPEPAKAASVTRRYLFYSYGYYKSDKAKTIPWTVAPLPFAAMSNFPYDPAIESYPTDAAHQLYQSTYNTRLE